MVRACGAQSFTAVIPHEGPPGPAKGVHALQIEVNRALYVDEASLTPTPGFARLKADLERLFEGLAETDWAGVV